MEPLSQGAIVALRAFPTNCFKRNHRQPCIPHILGNRYVGGAIAASGVSTPKGSMQDQLWYQCLDENLHTHCVFGSGSIAPPTLWRLCSPATRRTKNGQNQPFWQIFGFLPPQKRILLPPYTPKKFWCRHWSLLPLEPTYTQCFITGMTPLVTLGP